MPRVANWIQWTVVFLFLGSGAWIAYPAIDPLDRDGGISFSQWLKREASTSSKIAAFGKDSRKIHRKPLLTASP
jgi:hypothetical protein